MAIDSYRSFVQHVATKVDNLHKGVYRTDVQNDKYYQILKSHLVNSGKLQEFMELFEFVKCLRDIYSHPFVDNIVQIAKSLGARPFAWICEHDESLDWWEAFQILQGKKPIDDLSFDSIGFVKEEDKPWGWIGTVACVRLLRIYRDEHKKIQIDVVKWSIVQVGIGQVRASFS